MADENEPEAGGPPPLRASDEDRQHVADALRTHTSAGRLTLEEFEQRVAVAYAAKTVAELRPLVADLPVDLGSLLPAEHTAHTVAPLPWMPQGGAPAVHHPAGRPPWVRPIVFTVGLLFLLAALGVIGEWAAGAAWPLLIFGLILIGRSGRHGHRRHHRH